MAALAAAAIPASAAADAPAGNGHRPTGIQHVLLLSVDGLHQQDLAWYVHEHPNSTMAGLVGGGVEYPNASTPIPSDSFPGMVGQVTGGDPGVTGVYYDDTYNHALLPAGTTNCASAKPGVEIDFTEDLDLNKDSIDAGQGLSGLPNGILNMTGNPTSLINPAKLPVDPKTCKPVYPNSYVKVNTIFNVAGKAGLRTAWSDKHPAYQILNGPSGPGVTDMFSPEINSSVPGGPSGSDWTTDNAYTRQYDSYKVRAVLNEIDGYDHSRTHKVGTPAIFGMNFQTVSTAEKLPTSDGQTGGYLADGVTPGPLLSGSLDYINTQLTSFVSELRKAHLDGNTQIILSAKHGQSPTKPAALTRIDDGKLIDGLNAAWDAAHPGAGPLVAQATDDDAMMMWLNDRSPAATSFAKSYLLAQNGTGNGIDGKPKPFTASGLQTLYAGAEAAKYFHVAPGDSRVPDLWGVVRYGVVYTGGQGKIAEHGGAGQQDRNVPLVVTSADACGHGSVVRQPVETTQIAPTILRLLGLNPNALQAVQIEHTAVLPGVMGR
ncbi:MAG TPA: alkaline phosphatase family protein [Pseudonocardiaceae bacterium]|nr:alkaline phosphatase family protein [Pseudonocardiaceae bacterium]